MTYKMQYPEPELVKSLFDNERNNTRKALKQTMDQLFKLIKSKNLSFAFAESVTGGLLMSQFVSIPGISEFLKGGIVCYQPEVKINMLNVPKELIEKHSSESIITSTAIAEGLKFRIPSDVSTGITGLASKGASSSKNKPVGSIYLSIIFRGCIYQTSTVINGSRWTIRHGACLFAINELLQILSSNNYPTFERIKDEGITNHGRRLITYKKPSSIIY